MKMHMQSWDKLEYNLLLGEKAALQSLVGNKVLSKAMQAKNMGTVVLILMQRLEGILNIRDLQSELLIIRSLKEVT